MDLNPNIILGGKPVEPANPLTMATQALNLKDLAMKSQMQNYQMQQAMAQRQAAAGAISTDQNGNPQFDSQKYLSSVAQTNPAGFQQAQQDQTQMSLAQHKQHVDQRMDAQQDYLSSDHSDDSYQKMVSTMNRQGLDTSMYPPTNPGPSLVFNAQQKLQPVKDQIDQGIKQQEQTNQAAKTGLESKKLDVEMAHYGNDKQMKAVEDFNQGVETARQSPDAQQNLKDILSAKKFNELVSQAPSGDLNKLNPQQSKLAIFEVVKAAGGGVPSDSEMHSMTPDNLAQKYASAIQGVTNKSQPANAGEFLQQGQDYMNGISGVGKQNLTDRSNRIADRLKPYLGDQNYQKIKGQISSEFADKSGAQNGDTHKDGNVTYKVVNGHWVAQ